MKTKPSEMIARTIQERTEQMNRAVEKLGEVNIDLIAEAFPQGHWSFGIFCEIEFCLPFNFELIDSFKDFMKMQYPDNKLIRESRHVWDESKQAGHFLYYKAFEVSYRTSREGTTCVLNKIGETTKTIPVFEVVCTEGAEEVMT